MQSKVLPQPHGLIGQCWFPFHQPSAKHYLTSWDHRYGAGASRGVSVYFSAFTGTYCTFSQRDGQAKWRAGYLNTKVVYLPTDVHPSRYYIAARLLFDSGIIPHVLSTQDTTIVNNRLWLSCSVYNTCRLMPKSNKRPY